MICPNCTLKDLVDLSRSGKADRFGGGGPYDPVIMVFKSDQVFTTIDGHGMATYECPRCNLVLLVRPA